MTKGRKAGASQGSVSVSVVMTTYNGADFVEEAICSILNQTHRSLELVVVDDGSTDKTPAIIRGLASCESRLRFEAASHSGIAASRNKGLALAEGQFITFLDQDDLSPPGRIARQVARLMAEPDIGAVFGTMTMFEQMGQDGNIVACQGPSVTMLIAAALFRRDVFQDIGVFDTAYTLADDFDFVLRLIESTRRIEVEDHPGVFHRRHAGQCTADRSATRAECIHVLRQSLRRRRKQGIGPLKHPLVAAGEWLGP